jgi:hypothetical protein
MTISHLANMVEDATAIALEDVQVGPYLPVDLSPRDSVGFSDEGNKLLEVPRSVDDVLGPNLTVIINIGLGLTAMQDFPLAHREQLVAVCALVQVVALLLEKQF